jgi:hypothetical protein
MLKFMFILLLTFSLVAACFLCLFRGRYIWLISRARRKGFGSPKGRPTMFHVRDLLLKQEKDMAIQMYCEIFRVGKKEAKKAVDELERSIQNKH